MIEFLIENCNRAILSVANKNKNEAIKTYILKKGNKEKENF